ncbi:hypothetical protein NSPZN2_100217 [Nitrospira defluvii]|uniref:Secreted protein n=1 Tax=Nitrospira defluvii TaxID=330214 RepID=A0ABM8R1S9_9BACT|nr:hypothetical protein NSPZN2_100217 [Nitrospira defluvii]
MCLLLPSRLLLRVHPHPPITGIRIALARIVSRGIPSWPGTGWALLVTQGGCRSLHRSITMTSRLVTGHNKEGSDDYSYRSTAVVRLCHRGHAGAEPSRRRSR